MDAMPREQLRRRPGDALQAMWQRGPQDEPAPEIGQEIVVAGLLWSGPPRRLIGLAIQGQAVELFSSPVRLDELAHAPGCSKLDPRIEDFGAGIAVLRAQHIALVSLVAPGGSSLRVRSLTSWRQEARPDPEALTPKLP
jgi:hypothetical protein